MRRVVALAATVTLAAVPSLGRADGDECRGGGLSTVTCHIGEQAGGPGSSSSGTHTRIDPADVLYWPDLVFDPNVGFCVNVRREVFPGAAGSRRAMEAEARMLRMFATYNLCPGVPRPPRGPRTVARDVIESFLPAAPQPEIDPGFAITGKPAYLETKGNLHPATETRTTELGPINVTFAGRYRVDWGDGTAATRHDVEGQPWPDGRITHTYVTARTYDVVVTIEWRADWQIGPLQDRIDTGLQSEGRITDFPVRELQAVRDR